jgi:uncharacterized protein YraI
MKARVFFLVCALVLAVLFTGASVKRADAQLATPVAVVNVSFLNLRTGPGPQYLILAQLVGGTTLPVLGTNSDSSWLLVQSPVGTGWVYAQFTLPRGDFRFTPTLEDIFAGGSVTLSTPLYIGLGEIGSSTVAEVTSFTLPVPVLQPPTLVVNTSFLNIRSGPGGYFGVIGTLSGGTRVTPLGITNDGEWFLIEGSFGRGWVDQDFVLFRGEINNVPIVFAY